MLHVASSIQIVVSCGQSVSASTRQMTLPLVNVNCPGFFIGLILSGCVLCTQGKKSLAACSKQTIQKSVDMKSRLEEAILGNLNARTEMMMRRRQTSYSQIAGELYRSSRDFYKLPLFIFISLTFEYKNQFI